MLSRTEVAERQTLIKDMLRNKKSLVNKYGPNAEKIMYGKATKVILNKRDKE